MATKPRLVASRVELTVKVFLGNYSTGQVSVSQEVLGEDTSHGRAEARRLAYREAFRDMDAAVGELLDRGRFPPQLALAGLDS
jgi:hypothetical protein